MQFLLSPMRYSSKMPIRARQGYQNYSGRGNTHYIWNKKLEAIFKADRRCDIEEQRLLKWSSKLTEGQSPLELLCEFQKVGAVAMKGSLISCVHLYSRPAQRAEHMRGRSQKMSRVIDGAQEPSWFFGSTSISGEVGSGPNISSKLISGNISRKLIVSARLKCQSSLRSVLLGIPSEASRVAYLCQHSIELEEALLKDLSTFSQVRQSSTVAYTREEPPVRRLICTKSM